MVGTLKRSQKYPENPDGPWKNMKKARENGRLVRNDCSGGHIFNFGS